jgi:hypothetical protein
MATETEDNPLLIVVKDAVSRDALRSIARGAALRKPSATDPVSNYVSQAGDIPARVRKAAKALPGCYVFNPRSMKDGGRVAAMLSANPKKQTFAFRVGFADEAERAAAAKLATADVLEAHQVAMRALEVAEAKTRAFVERTIEEARAARALTLTLTEESQPQLVHKAEFIVESNNTEDVLKLDLAMALLQASFDAEDVNARVAEEVERRGISFSWSPPSVPPTVFPVSIYVHWHLL